MCVQPRRRVMLWTDIHTYYLTCWLCSHSGNGLITADVSGSLQQEGGRGGRREGGGRGGRGGREKVCVCRGTISSFMSGWCPALVHVSSGPWSSPTLSCSWVDRWDERRGRTCSFYRGETAATTYLSYSYDLNHLWKGLKYSFLSDCQLLNYFQCQTCTRQNIVLLSRKGNQSSTHSLTSGLGPVWCAGAQLDQHPAATQLFVEQSGHLWFTLKLLTCS